MIRVSLADAASDAASRSSVLPTPGSPVTSIPQFFAAAARKERRRSISASRATKRPAGRASPSHASCCGQGYRAWSAAVESDLIGPHGKCVPLGSYDARRTVISARTMAASSGAGVAMPIEGSTQGNGSNPRDGADDQLVVTKRVRGRWLTRWLAFDGSCGAGTEGLRGGRSQRRSTTRWARFTRHEALHRRRSVGLDTNDRGRTAGCPRYTPACDRLGGRLPNEGQLPVTRRGRPPIRARSRSAAALETIEAWTDAVVDR